MSSIEILVVDQMDALTMQNWEHMQVCSFPYYAERMRTNFAPLQFVMSHLNQLPKESHDVDFSRIKPWYLDGL